MSLSNNVLLYIVISVALGYLFRTLKNSDGSAKFTWQTAGIIIGVVCAIANVAFAMTGLPFGGAFNLDTRLGLFGGNLLTGLIIGIPIGMIVAYDMARRFTLIDGWMLFFKIGIIYVVIGGSISSLAIPRYTTQQWFDFFIFGLAQGGIYALIALGYTLVYGILFMINFAHGEIFMVGAYTAFYAANALSKPGANGAPAYLDTHPFISLLIIFAVAIITSTVVAVLVERIAYRPLRRAPRLVPLITAIGASFFLQYSVRGFYGSGVQAYPQVKALDGNLLLSDFMTAVALALIVAACVYLTRPLGEMVKKSFPRLEWAPPAAMIGAGLIAVYIGYLISAVIFTSTYPMPLSRIQFVIIIASVVMMGGLYSIVHFTKIGKAMRAVSEDKDVAALMGIDVDRIITITFALGASLAGAAGVLYALMFRQVHFFMGFLPGLKAFTAAVLGGIGNVPGAMLGGFFLGIVESVGPSLFLEGLGIPAAYQLKDVIAFTMLVLVLIFRPTGIMGVEVGKKKA